MSPLRRFMPLLALIVLSVGGRAHAAPITYDFTGQIITRFSTIYSLPPELVPGASFAGRITYDTDGLADLDPNPDHSFFLGAILDFEFDVGGVHWSIDPTLAPGRSWHGIAHNVPAPLTGELIDFTDINSTNAFANTAYIDALAYAWVGIGANGPTGVLDSADPLTDLSVFPLDSWIMQWTFVDDPIFPTTYYAQAVGRLSSLTRVTSVGEPSTWALLLMGLLVGYAAVRVRSTNASISRAASPAPSSCAMA